MENAVSPEGGALQVRPDAARHLEKWENLITGFRVACARNLHADDPCHARSWWYARWYMRVSEQMLAVYRAMVSGDQGAVPRAWKQAKAWLFEHEAAYQRVFDVWSFCRGLDRLLLDGFCSAAPEDVV
jgi:hypothetical protein